MIASLVSVNVGLPRAVAWNGRTVQTSIWKSPVRGRVLARRINLEGDAQTDLQSHGGEQRAILVYQLSSYRYWHELLGLPVDAFGQYGENFTVEGLDDVEVCIGDRYRIGDALFEVSQPRVTCYRLGLRLEQPQLPALFVAHGRPGFYMRVIGEGHVQAGDAIRKVASGPEGMAVAEIDALLYKAAHPADRLERALRIPALSPGWRRSFQALLQAAVAGPIRGNPGLHPAAETSVAWTGFASLRVIGIQDEAEDVRSFMLASARDVPLPLFSAGQHVALRLMVSGVPLTRMYSLSGDPRTGTYRIGVKRELDGLASKYLYEDIQVGDSLEVSAPRGTFGLQAGERPIVFLSGGIGVTPLLCMLHALAAARTTRQVWWLHGARDGLHDAFRKETSELLQRLPSACAHIVYSRPRVQDVNEHGFDEAGHIDLPMLARLGVSPDSDFYLCGPSAFLATLTSQLHEQWGLGPSRVHSEVFGPAVTVSDADRPPPHVPSTAQDAGPRVTFARSGLVVRWSDARQSLLELTEACDVATRWSCRSGVCQSCETPVITGTVAYAPEPIAVPSEGTILLCCARPAGDIELDL